ncbi:MAG: sensor histidine kinase [Ignavibacteriales bacterium]|nr:MAG: sensor histidine kinase [Ignavibacteriales bacterium]
MEKTITTYYDSPERTSDEKINSESQKLIYHKIVQTLLDGFPELAVILDKNRQIVAANKKAIAGFRKSSFEEIKGKRVGEAISCIHSDEMGKDSCGTSKFCAECGAAHAIKFTNENKLSSEEECRIISELSQKEESFDFKVNTSLLDIDEEQYTIFAIRDISGDKRRQALERIFFHDVLNTASVVNNFSLLLKDAEEDEFDEILPSLIESSDQLIQEILTQRDLRNAEDGKLSVDYQTTEVNDILRKVYSQYSKHQLTKDKKLTLAESDPFIKVNTDKKLLVRCFGNLVKNAIEASSKNDEIKIYSTIDNDHIIFSVQNPQIIPEVIQLQIFQRSFSTKGYGRGIGTYSVKLLVEQYLSGEVFFTSQKPEGTIFSIKINRNV